MKTVLAFVTSMLLAVSAASAACPSDPHYMSTDNTGAKIPSAAFLPGTILIGVLTLPMYAVGTVTGSEELTAPTREVACMARSHTRKIVRVK